MNDAIEIDFVRDSAEWDGLLGNASGVGFTQTWEFGSAKCAGSDWTVQRVKASCADGPLAVCQALTRRIPVLGGGLAWINRGPVFLDHPYSSVEARARTLSSLHSFFAEQQGLFVRLAPAIGLRAEDFRGSGLVDKGRRGWASAILDLAPEEAVLASGLRKTWRTEIARGRAAGVEARRPRGTEANLTFVENYARFLERRRLKTSVTPALLSAIFRHAPPERQPAIFVASAGGPAESGVLTVDYFGTREYLASWTSEAGAPPGGGQLALWTALLDARSAGIRRFDVGGLDPENTPEGIRRFKEGLRAVPYRLSNELETLDAGWRQRLTRWASARGRSA